MTNALHWAAQTGRLDVCRYLLEDLGFDIEFIDDNLISLAHAAFFGKIGSCQYILERGGKVDGDILTLY